MQLVVLGVLSLVLAFDAPPFARLHAPGLVVLCVAIATLLPPLLGMWASHRALVRLEADPNDPADGQQAYGQGAMVTQWLLGGLHASVLLLTDWFKLCYDAPIVGGWPLAPGMIAALPFLLSVVLVWVALFPAERAIRQVALEVYLLRGRPVHPVWSLGRYLVFNLRHQLLFLLLPLLFLLLVRDLLVQYKTQLQGVFHFEYVPDLGLGIAALLVAVFAPEMLRHVWETQRLPDGPLRDRLQMLCRKLRLRCREILVWRSGGMIVNAAVMGVIAPLRYVLITDALLEQMDDEKIEAVFGHEAGHARRHHIVYFLLFAFISGCLITILSAWQRGLEPAARELAMVAMVVLLGLKWGVVFGWISRNFERQADVFGVRTLALAGIPCRTACALHENVASASDDDVIDGRRLCRTSAHIFGDTLNEVAVLNGIPPEAWSWRHGSIARRSRFVQELAADTIAAARFERRIAWIKRGILAGALVFGLWAGASIQIWKLL